MLITEKGSICSKAVSYFLLQRKNGRKPAAAIVAMSRDRDSSDKTRNHIQEEEPVWPFTLKVSNPIIARSAAAVFALGFVDAGYSGDWSRIGVITKESEDLLKVAAFLLVPLCLFLILSLSENVED